MEEPKFQIQVRGSDKNKSWGKWEDFGPEVEEIEKVGVIIGHMFAKWMNHSINKLHMPDEKAVGLFVRGFRLLAKEGDRVEKVDVHFARLSEDEFQEYEKRVKPQKPVFH